MAIFKLIIKKYAFYPFCLSLFLLTILFHTGCSHKDKKRKRQATDLHLNLGSQFLSSGNYPAAFRELSRAKELHPYDPVVYNLLGLTYAARKRFQLAESSFKKAIELDPEYSEARNNLGRLYIKLRRYPSAITEIKKAIEDLKYHAPERSHANLGLVYYKMKDWPLAEKSFATSIELNNKYCQGHIYYGRTLLKQEKFKKASRTFDTAIEFCDNFDVPFYYSALSYLYAGSQKTAKSRFEDLLMIYPNSKYRYKTYAHLKKLEK